MSEKFFLSLMRKYRKALLYAAPRGAIRAG
jgi:hypothetical protein